MPDKSYANITDATFIDEGSILDALVDANENPSPSQVSDILGKAALLQGLEPSEAAVLMNVKAPEQLQQMFQTAIGIKERIYQDRIVLFAPLYISNLCKNECSYCGFRRSNKEINRKALTLEETRQQIEELLRTGQKRVLMVAGESYTEGKAFDYVLDSVSTIYRARDGKAGIKRVNANIAPLSIDGYRKLIERNVGTCQIFQETYHQDTYAKVHEGGPKRNYFNRVNAFDRAMEAGGENGMDVGLGALLGLYDWRFEVLGLLQHSNHLLNTFGVGPHTISVPRIEAATGSELASHPPHKVSDDDFKKLVAVLRLSVPYTGIIMSTRENEEMRRTTLKLGVSQISAASRTDPGGYTGSDTARKDGQFFTGDHRDLHTVMLDLVREDYIPSFCVGCEENGRMGKAFMETARKAQIGGFCTPNALITFEEFLSTYAQGHPENPVLSALYTEGEALIDRKIQRMKAQKAPFHNLIEQRINAMRQGQLAPCF